MCLHRREFALPLRVTGAHVKRIIGMLTIHLQVERDNDPAAIRSLLNLDSNIGKRVGPDRTVLAAGDQMPSLLPRSATIDGGVGIVVVIFQHLP